MDIKEWAGLILLYVGCYAIVSAFNFGKSGNYRKQNLIGATVLLAVIIGVALIRHRITHT